jgi:hypothetical protein
MTAATTRARPRGGQTASLLLLAAVAELGCGGGSTGKPNGSGGNGAGTGTGGAGGVAAGEINRSCAEAMRVGGFELIMVSPTPTVTGYAQLTGSVQDKVTPSKVWTAATSEGDCRLMLGPSCSTSCTLPTVCDGSTCVPGPTTETVGMVTVTGLKGALSATPNMQKNYYAPVSGFPPVDPGAEVVLTASGGDYAGFSLRGAGFPIIESPSKTLPFAMGKAFTVTWTPPPAPVVSRMFVKLDIAFHGGVDAQIQCDAPDTGSLTVPASLVDALIAKGIAGFPSAFLTRRTIDAVDVGGGVGCVDFAISNTFNGTTGIQLMIAGVTSCNKDTDCPSGMTCGTALTCH